MTHDPLLLDYLESLEQKAWSGSVFRYTIGDRPPDRENTMGARWNPQNVGAVYTALHRPTVTAELRHFVGSLSPRPSRMRVVLHTIQVSLQKILDLSSKALLRRAGIDEEQLASQDYGACQRVGGAAYWLGAGGLLVPSARERNGTNLIIYPMRQAPDFEFEVEESEPLELAEILGGRK